MLQPLQNVYANTFRGMMSLKIYLYKNILPSEKEGFLMTLK